MKNSTFLTVYDDPQGALPPPRPVMPIATVTMSRTTGHARVSLRDLAVPTRTLIIIQPQAVLAMRDSEFHDSSLRS